MENFTKHFTDFIASMRKNMNFFLCNSFFLLKYKFVFFSQTITCFAISKLVISYKFYAKNHTNNLCESLYMNGVISKNHQKKFCV